MKKETSQYTHIIYINNHIDSNLWAIYAPFCGTLKINDIECSVMLCSNIDFFGPFIQTDVHFKNAKVNIKFPSSLALLIQEVSDEAKPQMGFAPQFSQ